MDNNQAKKILLVEDDQFLREFYQELLTGEGYIIDVAVDGASALSKIQTQDYDLALLDIMLPKLDGLQILRELKIHPPKTANLEIVVLTNLGQESVVKECFNLGVEGFLIKSALNPAQILAEIKGYLYKS